MRASQKRALSGFCVIVGAGLLMACFLLPEWTTSSASWPIERLGSFGLSLVMISCGLMVLLIPSEKTKASSWSHDDIQTTLDELQEAQDKLVLQEHIVQVGLLTAGIAHEIKNPLNFVTNFSSMSIELVDELQEILEPILDKLEDEAKQEAQSVLEDLKTNNEKVLEHGKRAESIVMNMLAQARAEEPTEKEDVNMNQLVEESINLAYHGLRAQNPNFNISIKKHLQADLGNIACLKQPVSRVLLNILNNAMYAAFKKTEQDEHHDPAIDVITKGDDKNITIKIRDNGVGIPKESLKNIFVPFYTTKPKGQGTGLGLSICHDIIVKNHGGSIEVDSKVNEHTEFTITLPRQKQVSE